MCRWRDWNKTCRRKSATFCSILVSHCEWINCYRQLQIVLCCTLWMDYWRVQRRLLHVCRNRQSPEGRIKSDFRNAKKFARIVWWNGNRHVCIWLRRRWMRHARRVLADCRLSDRHLAHVVFNAITLIAMCRNCPATSSISYAMPDIIVAADN